MATGDRFKYYPYSEENATPTTPRDRVKFGTYTRDAATGLDYADQRYYSSISGPFLTPDPGDAGDMDNPQSLNLYTYVNNDSINFNDPEGTTVNIPLDDGASPTSCLNYKLEPWMKSHGFSAGDNFGDFGNTAVGTLGITLYEEFTAQTDFSRGRMIRSPQLLEHYDLRAPGLEFQVLHLAQGAVEK
jgi:RHS repeat-associated protein